MRQLLASILLTSARLYRRYSPTIRGTQYVPELAIKLCKTLQNKEPFSLWRTREIQRNFFPIKLTYDAMSTVGAILETKEIWELNSVHPMITQLRADSGTSGAKTVMLDIGANYGLYSITAACHVPHCQAYAFECNPSILGILQNNVTLNSTTIDQSDSNVTVVGKAVSDRSGSAQFIERIDDGHGSLQTNEAGSAPSPRGIIDVQTIDGEWMTKNLDFEIIHFCKIDVEGAEQNVISGLKNLLIEKRIKRIQIEVMSRNLCVLDELRSYGYTIEEGDYDLLRKHGLADFYLTAKE